jgi:hypothetical protein
MIHTDGVEASLTSFLFDGKSDQKNPRHSDSSNIYGSILVNSRTQFNTKIKFRNE